jgi:hypothetical protein
MDRVRPILTWAKSAYIVYGMVFVGVLGGLIQVLALADQINYGLVRLLELNPAGPELNGRFLFPKNWFVLGVMFLSLVLLFPATSILRFFVEADPRENIKLQVTGLRRDIDDIIRFADNITGYMYSADVDIGRLDTISVHTKHNIMDDGEAFYEAIFVIQALAEPAHFWRYWIDADPESDPVTLLKDLKFEAIDADSGVKLDWLPIKHEDHSKTFAIFFPEIRPHTKKTLKVSFRWRGFVRKFVELGATSFDWRYVSKTNDLRASMRHEWNFSDKLGTINCRMTGRQSQTASLRSESRANTITWIYEDPEAMMNVEKRSVEFVRVGP